jgi:hypothetical protein
MDPAEPKGMLPICHGNNRITAALSRLDGDAIGTFGVVSSFFFLA